MSFSRGIWQPQLTQLVSQDSAQVLPSAPCWAVVDRKQEALKKPGRPKEAFALLEWLSLQTHYGGTRARGLVDTSHLCLDTAGSFYPGMGTTVAWLGLDPEPNPVTFPTHPFHIHLATHLLVGIHWEVVLQSSKRRSLLSWQRAGSFRCEVTIFSRHQAVLLKLVLHSSTPRFVGLILVYSQLLLFYFLLPSLIHLPAGLQMPFHCQCCGPCVYPPQAIYPVRKWMRLAMDPAAQLSHLSCSCMPTLYQNQPCMSLHLHHTLAPLLTNHV